MRNRFIGRAAHLAGMGAKKTQHFFIIPGFFPRKQKGEINGKGLSMYVDWRARSERPEPPWKPLLFFIFLHAPEREMVEIFLKKAIDKYAVLAPRLADWMEVNIPEGFTVLAFLKTHQKKLRASN